MLALDLTLSLTLILTLTPVLTLHVGVFTRYSAKSEESPRLLLKQIANIRHSAAFEPVISSGWYIFT